MAVPHGSIRLGEGVAYNMALYFRYVSVGVLALDRFEEPESLKNIPHTVSIPEWNRESCDNAVAVLNHASNEPTFRLILPFLITDWLRHLPRLKFFVSTQWELEQLATDDSEARPLSMPKPDLTIAIKWRSLFPGQDRILPPVLPMNLFPIPGDIDNGPVIFTVEAKYDMREARLQNLHSAALTLSGLRQLFQRYHGTAQGFDGKVRVLSAGITRYQVSLFGHWTAQNGSNVRYEHFLIRTWFLDDDASLYVARVGLERSCQWIMKETEEWLTPVMQQMRGTLGPYIAAV